MKGVGDERLSGRRMEDAMEIGDGGSLCVARRLFLRLCDDYSTQCDSHLGLRLQTESLYLSLTLYYERTMS